MSAPAPDTRARLQTAMASIPYAGFLGVRAELHGDEVTLILPFKPALVGNPMLPALHGGVVGAFMELAAIAQLSVDLQADGALPKTIDFGIDFLRSGRPVDTFARAKVVKVGRRIANVAVEAWQQERTAPIATLRGHFLVRERDQD